MEEDGKGYTWEVYTNFKGVVGNFLRVEPQRIPLTVRLKYL